MDTKDFFYDLFQGKLTDEVIKETLINLYNKGESSEDIFIAAKAMREFSIKLNISDDLKDKIIDNCGTGGDSSGSFNISTTVSLLLASLGSFVAKHGNVSITSKSGSANLLMELGINLDKDIQARLLEESGFCFLFAKNHHPVMKYVMPVRQKISHRTIFNILGPLTNPAGANKQLIGVFSKDYILRITEALYKLGTKKAIVVSSKDGLDEISISDITYGAKLENNNITEFEINPIDYGLKLYDKKEILGGDPKENVKITRGILSGEITGAKLDIVLLNTAYALLVDGKITDIKEGIELAKEAIYSKKAIEKLDEIIKISNKF